MNMLYIVVVNYIDGVDLLGVFNNYIEAEKMIKDLKKYDIVFGTEETFIIYEFNEEMLNKYISYKNLEKLEVARIKGNN